MIIFLVEDILGWAKCGIKEYNTKKIDIARNSICHRNKKLETVRNQTKCFTSRIFSIHDKKSYMPNPTNLFDESSIMNMSKDLYIFCSFCICRKQIYK